MTAGRLTTRWSRPVRLPLAPHGRISNVTTLRRKWMTVLAGLAAVAVALGTALAISLFADPAPLSGKNPLVEIQDLETLRSQFNQDVGKIRLILFLSPTSGDCLAGARWVAGDILWPQPTDFLRVYAVWMPMLPADVRESWDGGRLTDSRVLHYWDEARITGSWFAQEVDNYNGVSWNSYYLYGPQASWDEVPSPLQDSGTDISARAGILRPHLKYLIWSLESGLTNSQQPPELPVVSVTHPAHLHGQEPSGPPNNSMEPTRPAAATRV
jgi:hypothetical protein